MSSFFNAIVPGFILLFMTTNANAQPANPTVDAGPALASEYLHQAPAGSLEVIPAIDIEAGQARERNSSIKYSSVAAVLGSDVEYGINSVFAIGGGLHYAFGATSIENCPANTTCDSTKGHGLEDPFIVGKATIPLTSGALRMAVRISTSLGAYKIEKNGDYNFSSGGTTGRATLGYEHYLSRQVIGGNVYYDLYQGDRKWDDSTSGSSVTAKIGGGNLWGLAGFYEYHFHMFTAGTALTFDKAPGTGVSVGSSNADRYDESRTWALKFYSPIQFNERIALLPSLAFAQVNYGQSQYFLKDGSGFKLACAGRFSF